MNGDHLEFCPAFDHTSLNVTETLKRARLYWSAGHLKAKQPRMGLGLFVSKYPKDLCHNRFLTWNKPKTLRFCRTLLFFLPLPRCLRNNHNDYGLTTPLVYSIYYCFSSIFNLIVITWDCRFYIDYIVDASSNQRFSCFY